MSETVIQVENLSKKYRLGVINRQMLVDQIESWVARKLGKPDPHASIFEHATDRMPTPYDFWALHDRGSFSPMASPTGTKEPAQRCWRSLSIN